MAATVLARRGSKWVMTTYNPLTVVPSASISSKMIGGKYLRAEIVRKKGRQLVNDPIYNKGLGYPYSERDRLSIRYASNWVSIKTAFLRASLGYWLKSKLRRY